MMARVRTKTRRLASGPTSTSTLMTATMTPMSATMIVSSKDSTTPTTLTRVSTQMTLNVRTPEEV